MIQRIQTLWLLLAILCMASCFLFPTAIYTLNDDVLNQTTEARLDLVAKSNPEMLNEIAEFEPKVTFSQADSSFSTWPLLLLNVLTIAVAAVSIFLFHYRMRQVKIVMVAFMLNLAYAFVVFFWAVDKYADIVRNYMHLTDMHITWSVSAYAPIASLLFIFLAQRAIRKDEAKVRAADRLR